MQPRDTRGIPSTSETSGGSATARVMAASYTQEGGMHGVSSDYVQWHAPNQAFGSANQTSNYFEAANPEFSYQNNESYRNVAPAEAGQHVATWDGNPGSGAPIQATQTQVGTNPYDFHPSSSKHQTAGYSTQPSPYQSQYYYNQQPRKQEYSNYFYPHQQQHTTAKDPLIVGNNPELSDEKYSHNAVAPPDSLLKNVHKYIPPHARSKSEVLGASLPPKKNASQPTVSPAGATINHIASSTRPAYLSVGNKKPAMESAKQGNVGLNPSKWPPSIKVYVQRAFKSTPVRKRQELQQALRCIISDAEKKGELWTRPWDELPLPDLNQKPEEAAATVNEMASVFLENRAVRSTSKSITFSKQDFEPKPSKEAISVPKMVSNDAYKTDFPHVDSNARKRKFFTSYTGSDSDSGNSSQGGAYAENEEKRRKHRANRFKDEEKQQSSRGGGSSSTKNRRRNIARRISEIAIKENIDIDWDAFAIKGSCQELEKSYFRLTSAPDPKTVRPKNVLQKALKRLVNLLANGEVTYFYALDQFKGMRQDCVVQAIKGPLALDIYECHARAALEYGDIAEYNQCQGQMATIRSRGVTSSHGRKAEIEFTAYRVLYQAVHSKHGEASALLGTLQRLTKDEIKSPEVEHALSVRAALASNDSVAFFKLYQTAPKLGRALMDIAVPNVRFKFLSAAVKAFKPTIDIEFLVTALGFCDVFDRKNVDSYEMKQRSKDNSVPLPGCKEVSFPGKYSPTEDFSDGKRSCIEWLAECDVVIVGSGTESSIDCKASLGRMHMPTEKDAVAHGDANLDIGDFLKNLGNGD